MRGMCRCHLTGLFEVRAADYLDSYPEPEPSGVNKFLKGLGKSFSAFAFVLNEKIKKENDLFLLFYSQKCLFAGNKMKFLQKK